MKKRNGPRKLRVLRVEDEEEVEFPEWLPVAEVGRIREWGSFVLGLSRGGIFCELPPDYKKCGPIEHEPDIITIDFKFSNDETTPHKDPKRAQLSGEPVYAEIFWPEHLVAKNTGVLIGATLAGLGQGWDVPAVHSLHTGFAADTFRDVPTVLLVGQMLALGGFHFSEDRNPVVDAYKYFKKVPSDPEDAILKAIPSFRRTLLERLGLGSGADNEPVRLYPNADSIQHLRNCFDSVNNVNELDRRLDVIGLEFWDRAGKAHCLDLRSLFMDHLDSSLADEHEWGKLPLSSVKPPDTTDDEKPPAEALTLFQYVERVNELVKSYSHAADIVRANTQEITRKIRQVAHPSARLMGLVFAYVQATITICEDFKTAVLLPWNHRTDGPGEERHGAYTLKDCLKALEFVLKSADRLTEAPEQKAEDGFWPVTGYAPRGIKHIARDCCETWADKPQSRVLRSIMEYSDDEITPLDERYEGRQEAKTQTSLDPQRERIIDRLLAYLVAADTVAVEKREIGKSTKEFYKLRHSISNDLKEMRSPVVDDKKIEGLLGYSTTNNNILKRTIQDGGYPDKADFMEILASGNLPPQFVGPVRWYLSDFCELSEDRWPAMYRSILGV